MQKQSKVSEHCRVKRLNFVKYVEIDSLNKQRLPSEKIDTILEFCQCVYEQMKISGDSLGADDLIPILIRVLTLAKPSHLVSDLRFIQRFHNQALIKSKASYSFTNIVRLA